MLILCNTDHLQLSQAPAKEQQVQSPENSVEYHVDGDSVDGMHLIQKSTSLLYSVTNGLELSILCEDHEVIINVYIWLLCKQGSRSQNLTESPTE